MSMKTTLFKVINFSLLLFYFAINSCSIGDSKKVKSVVLNKDLLFKRWTLTNNNGKIEKGLATHIVMSLEKNRYFLVYDTIIDQRFIAAGISKIQPISKGQWKLRGDKLILTHLLPNLSHTEMFKVKVLKNNKLITLDSENKTHIYLHIKR